MTPRAGSPARASTRAPWLSDARLARLLTCAKEVDCMPVTTAQTPAPQPLWPRSRAISRLPGTPAQAGFGQRRRRGESRSSSEVKRVKRRARRGVACGERGQVPLLLDKLEHGGVVEDLGADVVRTRVRRHDHRRDPEPVLVVPAWPGV